MRSIWEAGGLASFNGGIVAAVSPTSSTVADNTATQTLPATGTFTATPAGQTYSWTIESASGATFTPNTSTAQTTTVAVSGATTGTATATLRCTINGGPSATASLSYTRVLTSVTPTSDTGNTGTTTSKTFVAFTASGGGGTASSYNWDFTSPSAGHTFTVNSGQSTATATPRVTGVAAGETASANFRCTITYTNGATDADTSAIDYQNTSSPSVTFSPVPGTLNPGEGATTTVQTITTSPSTSVTWTWSLSSGSTTGFSSSPTSGSAGTSWTGTLNQGTNDRSCNITLTASGAASGSWTINFFKTGTGGGVSTMTL
jgi:hypothetical protein